jgi:hypothetical protein
MEEVVLAVRKVLGSVERLNAVPEPGHGVPWSTL